MQMARYGSYTFLEPIVGAVVFYTQYENPQAKRVKTRHNLTDPTGHRGDILLFGVASSDDPDYPEIAE